MKKTALFTVIAAAALLLGSCSTVPICVTASITPMQGKAVAENLGKTEGTDTAVSIFGLFMVGRPDLDSAIKKALKASGGDSLINVSCYETYRWFVLLSATTVKVEGEAVRFGADNSESDIKKKGKKR